MALTEHRASGAAPGITKNKKKSPELPKILPSPRGRGAGGSCSESLGAWGWPSPSLRLPAAAAAFGESVVVLVALEEPGELSRGCPRRSRGARRGSEGGRPLATLLPSADRRCRTNRCVYLAFSLAPSPGEIQPTLMCRWRLPTLLPVPPCFRIPPKRGSAPRRGLCVPPVLIPNGFSFATEQPCPESAFFFFFLNL